MLLNYFKKVDKHIRRLDSDLARFEAELKDRSLSDTENTSPSEKTSIKYTNSLASMHDDASQNANDMSMNYSPYWYCPFKF